MWKYYKNLSLTALSRWFEKGALYFRSKTRETIQLSQTISILTCAAVVHVSSYKVCRLVHVDPQTVERNRLLELFEQITL
jgi:hypothetical protein